MGQIFSVSSPPSIYCYKCNELLNKRRSIYCHFYHNVAIIIQNNIALLISLDLKVCDNLYCQYCAQEFDNKNIKITCCQGNEIKNIETINTLFLESIALSEGISSYPSFKSFLSSLEEIETYYLQQKLRIIIKKGSEPNMVRFFEDEKQKGHYLEIVKSKIPIYMKSIKSQKIFACFYSELEKTPTELFFDLFYLIFDNLSQDEIIRLNEKIKNCSYPFIKTIVYSIAFSQLIEIDIVKASSLFKNLYEVIDMANKAYEIDLVNKHELYKLIIFSTNSALNKTFLQKQISKMPDKRLKSDLQNYLEDIQQKHLNNIRSLHFLDFFC